LVRKPQFFISCVLLLVQSGGRSICESKVCLCDCEQVISGPLDLGIASEITYNYPRKEFGGQLIKENCHSFGRLLFKFINCIPKQAHTQPSQRWTDHPWGGAFLFVHLGS
jgi:hypothetical protein